MSITANGTFGSGASTPANPATSPYGSGKDDTTLGALDGTPINIKWFDQLVNGTIAAALRAAGIVPNSIEDNADNSQILQAIMSLIAKGNLVNDLTEAGTPNTIILSSFRDVGDTYNITHPIAALQNLQTFRFVAAQTNTSDAVTLQGSQLLSPKAVSGVQAGDIVAGTLYIATYYELTDTFVIRPEVYIPQQPNILDNGDFVVWQRGGTFNAATTFTNTDANNLADRWKGLDSREPASDSIDYSRLTLSSDVPEGARGAMQMVWQRNNQQGGLCQYIENDKTRDLVGKKVSLSFEAYASAGSTPLRAAVLSYQGAADSLPSDPVNTWQVGDLLFDGNFTVENTTADLTITNPAEWQRFTINDIDLDTANTNNLAVVIWTPQEQSTGFELRLSKIKLEQSSVATEWLQTGFTTEYLNCKKRWERARFVLLSDGNNQFGGDVFDYNFVVKKPGIPIITINTITNTTGVGGYITGGNQNFARIYFNAQAPANTYIDAEAYFDNEL